MLVYLMINEFKFSLPFNPNLSIFILYIYCSSYWEPWHICRFELLKHIALIPSEFLLILILQVRVEIYIIPHIMISLNMLQEPIRWAYIIICLLYEFSIDPTHKAFPFQRIILLLRFVFQSRKVFNDNTSYHVNQQNHHC